MAAAAGAQLLRCWGHEVAAISGVVSSSPLARREVEQTTNLPCLPEIELSRQALQLAGMVGQPADHAHVKAVA